MNLKSQVTFNIYVEVISRNEYYKNLQSNKDLISYSDFFLNIIDILLLLAEENEILIHLSGRQTHLEYEYEDTEVFL